jgi:uncharacterized protein YjiS (DUF1127 family)
VLRQQTDTRDQANPKNKEEKTMTTLQLRSNVESAPKPRRTLWQKLVGGIVLLIEAFAEARRLRQGIRELSKLDDRMLSDIGVARSGIEVAVRGRPVDESRAVRPTKPVSAPALRMAA